MSQQSKINSMPDGSYNKELYKALDQDRWVQFTGTDYNLIPKGYQVRYLTYDKDLVTIVFRSGGFLSNVSDDYIVLRGYSGVNFSVQKSRLVEVWYRPINRTRRSKKEK